MRKRLGEFLIENGFITSIQLKTSLEEQKNFGEKLGEILVKRGFISEGNLLEAIAEMKDVKFVDMANLKPSREALSLLPINFCKEHLVYPLRVREENRRKILYIAITDFYNLDLLTQIQFTTGVDLVEAVLATSRAIKAAIRRDYERQKVDIPALNYEKVSSFNQQEDDDYSYNENSLIIKSDEMYGKNQVVKPKPDSSNMASEKLASKILDLELEVESLRKRLRNKSEDLNLELSSFKKILDEKDHEMLTIEKRLIAVVKLLIKRGIFSKEDFFTILKKLK